jgi:hypothetical protein
MTVLDKILGGGKTEIIGGDVPEGLKPLFDPLKPKLTETLEEGPRVFEGQRVAAIDPESAAAQERFLALSQMSPTAYAAATAGIEEALGLQRAAAAPLTAEAIEQQRAILSPLADVQRRALERGRKTALKDIGLAFGDPRQGRAQVAALEAAGEYLGKEQELESSVLQQAISAAQQDRARQAAAASGIAGLAGQQLGVSQQEFGEQLQRTGLQAGVGEARRAFEQEQIGAEMAKFAERDPLAFYGRYAQVAGGVPVTAQQAVQKQSGFQQLAGLGLTAASMATPTNALGKLFGIKHGGMVGKYESGGGILSSIINMLAPKANRQEPQPGPYALQRMAEAQQREAAESQAPALAQLKAQTGESLTPLDVAAAQIMKEKDKKTSGIMAAAAADTPPSDIGIDAGASNTSGASQAEEAIKATSSAGGAGINLDLLRTGLSILATQPKLGESPIGATARGALGGLQAQMQDELARAKIAGAKGSDYLRGTLPTVSEYGQLAENEFQKQQISTSKYGDDINRIGLEASDEAIKRAQAGKIGSAPQALRLEAQRIFLQKLNQEFDFLPKDNTAGGKKQSQPSAPKTLGSTK